MRKFTVAAIAALVALAVAAVAFAAPQSTLDVKITPTKAGKKKRPRAAEIFVQVGTGTDDGSKPPTTRRLQLFLGKGLKLNAAKFPSCTEAKINQNPASCPAGSKVGRGSATALTTAGNNRPTAEDRQQFNVTAFNGPRGRSLILYIEGQTLDIRKVIVGKLSRAAGTYGYKLTFDIPGDVQQPAPGLYTPLIDFQTSVAATRRIKRKRVPYVATVSCPSNRKWAFKSITDYANENRADRPQQPSQTAEATSNCRR